MKFLLLVFATMVAAVSVVHSGGTYPYSPEYGTDEYPGTGDEEASGGTDKRKGYVGSVGYDKQVADGFVHDVYPNDKEAASGYEEYDGKLPDVNEGNGYGYSNDFSNGHEVLNGGYGKGVGNYKDFGNGFKNGFKNSKMNFGKGYEEVKGAGFAQGYNFGTDQGYSDFRNGFKKNFGKSFKDFEDRGYQGEIADDYNNVNGPGYNSDNDIVPSYGNEGGFEDINGDYYNGYSNQKGFDVDLKKGLNKLPAKAGFGLDKFDKSFNFGRGKGSDNIVSGHPDYRRRR